MSTADLRQHYLALIRGVVQVKGLMMEDDAVERLAKEAAGLPWQAARTLIYDMLDV